MTDKTLDLTKMRFIGMTEEEWGRVAFALGLNIANALDFASENPGRHRRRHRESALLSAGCDIELLTKIVGEKNATTLVGEIRQRNAEKSAAIFAG